MLGRLLGTAVRVVTLPVDAVNAASNIAGGGSGRKSERTRDTLNPLSDLENLRDRIAEAAEQIDD